MSEETVITSTETAVDSTVASAEKVTNLLGLADVTANLETLKNAVVATVTQGQAAGSAFLALTSSLKAHLEALNPATELAAAKSKIEGLVAEIEGLFKK